MTQRGRAMQTEVKVKPSRKKERKGPRQRLDRGPFREDIFGCDGDRILERA
ncbi:hypothetical protein GCM10010405_00150 [Streptomyces macrosporus]|uniref:Uncharacterized protein n=1 Tax=Streptomyces macrosporus TaxID=44032 RepID=A0ABN3J465_9ACTN